ncbi:MAG: SPASM domain-containing protein [Duncaniella sp.]|nr:SPASM domain-containing protein [Duncaniella sp.]
MLIQSLYTYFFEKEGRYFLYNSLSGLFCEISSETYENLYNRDYTCFDKETLDYFLANKILIPEEEKYLYYYECQSRFNSDAYNDESLSLVIAPTIMCNFNCPYCFESKESTAIMTEETASNLISFIKKHEKAKRLHLTWYGGEPLLAFNQIKSLWNKIADELPDIKISSHGIITNGWFLNNDVIQFFKETGLNHIQITLDGIKDHHNKTRCLKNGAPTFDVIFQNILSLAKAVPSLHINVRVNVNKHNNNDYSEISNLFKIEKLNNIHVYAGFIREDTADGRSMAFKSIATSSDCHNFYKSVSSTGGKSSFFPGIAGSRGCVINSTNSYIIGPTGEIYKCWNDVGHEDRIIGNIVDNIPTNKVRLFRYLNDTSAFSDKNCKECSVFPICSGGCGHYRYRNKYENANFEICTRFANKTVLEESLLMTISS